MVREDIARPQHLEQVRHLGTEPAQARLRGRRPWLLPEVGTVELRQRQQAAEVEQPVGLVDIRRLKLQLAGQQLEDFRRHARVNLEAHNSCVAAAAAKLGLDRGEEVLGFAVDVVEITVSRHAEGMVGDHLHAWEQRLQVKGDDVLERDVALTFDQRDEPREDGRHLDTREMLLLALWVADQNRQVQREMRDVWEGMAWVDGQRRQHREDLLPENRVQVAQLALGHLVGADKSNPRSGQGGRDLAIEQGDLALDKRLDPSPDRFQLIERRHAVRRRNSDRGQDLLFEPGHPNLEEVVEVLAEDGQELDPLEHREVGVLGHGELQFVEIEPGKLPIYVPGGFGQRGGRHARFRFNMSPHRHRWKITACRAKVG